MQVRGVQGKRGGEICWTGLAGLEGLIELQRVWGGWVVVAAPCGALCPAGPGTGPGSRPVPPSIPLNAFCPRLRPRRVRKNRG